MHAALTAILNRSTGIYSIHKASFNLIEGIGIEVKRRTVTEPAMHWDIPVNYYFYERSRDFNFPCICHFNGGPFLRIKTAQSRRHLRQEAYEIMAKSNWHCISYRNQPTTKSKNSIRMAHLNDISTHHIKRVKNLRTVGNLKVCKKKYQLPQV